MIDVFAECERILREASIQVSKLSVGHVEALGFEGTTVLGFLLLYPDTKNLLDRWHDDLATLIRENQFALRRARTKAWNTYAVLLSTAASTVSERALLSAIEEDLVGTRKIARAGITDSQSVRQAVLPLMPLQNAPRLEAVDMIAEIRMRTTELPSSVIEAFFSKASDEDVLQILENEP